MLRMNRWIGLTLATAGVSVEVVGLSADAAQALIITKEFRVDMTSGSLTGQSFFGNFSYDNASLTDPNLQTIDDTNGFLDLSFNFLGVPFTGEDDAFFSPVLYFQDGLFLGLDYLVSDNPANPNPRTIPGSFRAFGITGPEQIFFVTGDVVNGIPITDSEGTITYIPTPALLPGLIGMGLAALKTRRDKASKAA